MNNTLFYGDNLDILREHIADESVDLVYLDPPFNSNRNYNVLFKDEHGKDSEAQITAFTDTWHWNDKAEATYQHLIAQSSDKVSVMISALRSFIGSNQMMAYLVMMTARLIELHRVLKPTGSLYLHCDPTASHYLKIILDTIFNPQNYCNEIVWKRTSSHNDAKRYGANIDILLYYVKSRLSCIWNQQYTPNDPSYIDSFRNRDHDGRLWASGPLSAKGLSGGGYTYEYKGVSALWRCPITTMQRLDREDKLHFTKTGGIRVKRYLDETSGVPLQALWSDISPIAAQSLERLGYPTQKPIELLERIISASSNPGDVVLDPFCGCGTAIAAAQKLDRQWIGIDITHLSIALQKYRLEAMYPGIQFDVIGEPADIGAARALAHQDRYQFQWWALSLIRAKPLGGQEGSRAGRKGSDKGIDGSINFIDDASNKSKRVIVQVKSGHVKSGDIRDLVGTVQRENAAIGVFITLEPATKEMRTEAASAGQYHSIGWNKDYPRIQIVTIDELLHNAEVKMPPQHGTFKNAQRVQVESKYEQTGMFEVSA